MIQVVPAILTDDTAVLETLVRQAESFTDYVQIDIMDGLFVPSRSITSEHLSGLSMTFTWEAHLMVNRPEDCLEEFRQAGARRVIFHYEATSSPHEVIAKARNLGLEVGIGVNPETSIAALRTLVHAVDSILLLTVHPGFYGSKFLPEVLEKVAELRRIRPEVQIGVDGGIKENNIAQIAGSGVDTIYVGSAIFWQPVPGDSFNHLLNLAREIYRL